jgi:hypothetical protein
VTVSTEHTFLPDSRSPRLTTQTFREHADAIVASECPRLLNGASAALGAARFTLALNPDGTFKQATLDRTSGDETMDKMFGGLAAQLGFSRSQPAGARAPIVVGFSCSVNNSVATLELNDNP